MSKAVRIRTVEFDIRTIDINGDVIDIDQRERKDIAIDMAPEYMDSQDGAVAVIVERHTRVDMVETEYDLCVQELDNIHEVVHYVGDCDALIAGEWLD